MTRPPIRSVRKAIPLGVKLDVALRMLGFAGQSVHFDHDPALELRNWNEAAGDFDPPQFDPDFIVIRTVEGHDAKTNGPGGEKRITTRGSDTGEAKKIRRLTEAQTEFRRRMLAKASGEQSERVRPRKSKIPSRRKPQDERKQQRRRDREELERARAGHSER